MLILALSIYVLCGVVVCRSLCYEYRAPKGTTRVTRVLRKVWLLMLLAAWLPLFAHVVWRTRAAYRATAQQ